MKQVTLTLSILLVSISSSFSQLSINNFGQTISMPSGTSTQSLVVGDLNNDGKNEIISSNMGSGNVNVIINNCSPNRLNPNCLSQSFNLVPLTTGSPTIPAIGDLNLDGKPDIITGLYGSATAISIFLNQSTGQQIDSSTFIKMSLSGLNEPSGVAIGDVDGDGKKDILVANYNSATLRIYRNTTSIPGGKPTFTSSNFASGTNPNSVAIGDLDGDGKPEILCSNWGSSSLTVYKNNSTPGNLTLSLHRNLANSLQMGTNPYWVRVEDLNKDGLNEIICSNYTTGSVSIFQSTVVNSLVFNPRIDLSVSFPTNGTQSAGINDFDGDGLKDVCVANAISKEFKLFKTNSTTGSLTLNSFTSVGTLSSDGATVGVVGEDIDNDGRPEIIGANFEEGTISISKNHHLSFEPITPSTNFISTKTTNGATIKFTKGNGAKKLVIVRELNGIDVLPQDTNWYTSNDTFGNGSNIGSGNFVVYEGISDSISIKNLQSGKSYKVNIFEMNGFMGFSNYLTNNFLSGTIDLTNGINENTLNKRFNAYPNPADEFFLISEDFPKEFELYDLSGRIVLFGKTAKVNCETLTNGTYLLKVIDKYEHYFQRIIINK